MNQHTDGLPVPLPAPIKAYAVALLVAQPLLTFYERTDQVIESYQDRLTGRLVSIHDSRN